MSRDLRDNCLIMFSSICKYEIKCRDSSVYSENEFPPTVLLYFFKFLPCQLAKDGWAPSRSRKCEGQCQFLHHRQSHFRSDNPQHLFYAVLNVLIIMFYYIFVHLCTSSLSEEVNEGAEEVSSYFAFL